MSPGPPPARHRALCEPLASAAAGEALVLSGETAHHLARVARVRVGDAVALFDGRGREAPGRVAAVSAAGRGAEVTVRVLLDRDPAPGVTHDASAVIWLQGYGKGDKLDTVVRQATELGALSVRPVYTARSVPRASRDAAAAAATTTTTTTTSLDRSLERLRGIARAAATQCGRADLPEVLAPAPLDRALAALPAEAALRLAPWPHGAEPLAAALARAPASPCCAVLVGPEGGLDPEELALATRHGFVPVGLGPRVWRTETVAPALLGALSLARGDLRRGNTG